jgi:undecaprenyl-diphosphatase
MSSSQWRPPTVPIPSEVGRFDAAVDDWFDRHLRGRPWADRVMYTASALGDHGAVWMTLAVVEAIRQPAAWKRPLLRATAGLGLESALVNGPVKWIFRRNRPDHEGPRPLRLRTPRTSSFPSGHASAAFFAAALLRNDDDWWPAYYVIAVIVAASRVHVRIHHASDVVGGACIGVLLGAVARRLVPVGHRAGGHPGAESAGTGTRW